MGTVIECSALDKIQRKEALEKKNEPMRIKCRLYKGGLGMDSFLSPPLFAAHTKLGADYRDWVPK